MHAFDVLHADKRGNSIVVASTVRVSPQTLPIDEYQNIKAAYREVRFRQQRLKNFLENRDWYAGLDRLLSTTPYEQTVGNRWFCKDTRTAFQQEVKTMSEAELDHEGGGKTETPPNDDQIIYRAVQSYVYGRLQSKYAVNWQDSKGNEGKEKDFGDKKSKIAKDAFLAVRSRTEAADFQEYFAATLCSVSQRMDQKTYLRLTSFLMQEPQKARTLTLLALATHA